MGGAANLRYFVRDAFRSMRGNLATSVFTAATLGFSLAIFALFTIIFVNLDSALGALGDRTHVVAYVTEAGTGADAKAKELKRIPGVREVKFVSSQDALDEMKESLKGSEEIFEGLSTNPLPASFEIKLAEDYMDPARMQAVLDRLKAIKWVDDIQYSREWVQKFSAFLNFVELAALVLGVFLAVATVFIITNTIRLTVYARRDEIEVLRLVGASDKFIKAPFFIEGLVEGAAGGVIALVLLLFFRVLVAAGIPEFLSFVIDTPVGFAALAVILVVAGILMGVLGSLVSMARFLKV